VVCITGRVVEIIGNEDFESIVDNNLGLICLQRKGNNNRIEKPAILKGCFCLFEYSSVDLWRNCDNEDAIKIFI